MDEATSTAEPAHLKLVEPTYSVLAYASKDLPETYKNMVYSRWLRSLRFGNSIFKEVPSDIFYREWHAYIGKLLDKPDSKIRLAVLSDAHDVALGFSVSREDVLDYVHVQLDYRNHGIAKKLLPPKVTAFTHSTTTGLLIWRSKQKYRHLIFNPFA